MIAIIRIHGQVGLRGKIAETLNRLKLRRKFVCVLVDEKDEGRMGMVNSVKEFVAYGRVDDKFVKDLENKRGKDKKKGFFRLHPPVGGFKKSSKQLAPKGILGEHKDISKLLGRML